MRIRPATRDDDDAVWRVLEPTFRAGETWAVPRDVSRDDALAYFHAAGNATFVAEEDGAIVGSYLLRPNQRGGGAHVANAGYVVAPEATGRGVATAMCVHSLAEARARGFRAMQFNLVVASNTRAVALWQRLGFAVVGTLPEAFHHPRLGFVDAFVMTRSLVREDR